MSIDSRSPASTELLVSLFARLAEVRATARSYDFDEPKERAVARARALLELLVLSSSVTDLDLAVGIDGCIEITGMAGRMNLTVDVSPEGNRLDAVLDSERNIVWVGEDTSPEQLLKEIARAA